MKKVKLFTTIASLCLAVALMAFGVYAAANVNATVTGSITVEANGIEGTWAVDGTTVSDGDELAAKAINSDAGTVTYVVTFTKSAGTNSYTADCTATLGETDYFTIVSQNQTEGEDEWTIVVGLTEAAKGGKLTTTQSVEITIACTASSTHA